MPKRIQNTNRARMNPMDSPNTPLFQWSFKEATGPNFGQTQIENIKLVVKNVCVYIYIYIIILMIIMNIMIIIVIVVIILVVRTI